jgi:hypothetical protein
MMQKKNIGVDNGHDGRTDTCKWSNNFMNCLRFFFFKCHLMSLEYFSMTLVITQLHVGCMWVLRSWRSMVGRLEMGKWDL